MPNAAKITEEHVDRIMAESDREVYKLGTKTTVVMMVLPNDYVIVEHSSCVSPENYDQELGERLCLKKIKDKIWMLEGYVLQNNIYMTQKVDRLLER